MEDLNLENKDNKLSDDNERENLSEQENIDSSLRDKITKADPNEFKEDELTEKILKVTKIIKKKFPELSKFLIEVPESEVDYEHPEISLQDLRDYYQSLNSILVKYKLEHPDD
jgi:hypothetical protein